MVKVLQTMDDIHMNYHLSQQKNNNIIREKLRILKKMPKKRHFVILRFAGDLKF